GFTKNPEIRNAASITDYVFRWMALQFIPDYRERMLGNGAQPELRMPGLMEEMKKRVNRPVPELPLSDEGENTPQNNGATASRSNGHGHHEGRAITNLNDAIAHFQQDAPTCPTCGNVAVRNGACYKCLNCGESLGCS